MHPALALVKQLVLTLLTDSCVCAKQASPAMEQMLASVSIIILATNTQEVMVTLWCPVAQSQAIS